MATLLAVIGGIALCYITESKVVNAMAVIAFFVLLYQHRM